MTISKRVLTLHYQKMQCQVSGINSSIKLLVTRQNLLQYVDNISFLFVSPGVCNCLYKQYYICRRTLRFKLWENKIMGFARSTWRILISAMSTCQHHQLTEFCCQLRQEQRGMEKQCVSVKVLCCSGVERILSSDENN